MFDGLNALNIKNGASHSEFKIDENGDVGIIEIGARMGGDCIGSDLVKISTGYDFVEMVIDVAAGNPPKFKKVCEPKVAVIKFIFSKEDYENLERIATQFPKKLYYKSNIEDMNHDIIDSSSRYGFYIFAFDNKEEVEKILGDNL